MQSGKYTILVVDDEEKITEVVRSYLQHNGYLVHTVSNGSQALEAFEKTQPDLLILDLMLPDLSGEELCRTIRKKSDIPIIMLTAKVEEENIVSGLLMGADDYITKPFSPRQLVARVAALLRRASKDTVPLSSILEFNGGDLRIDTVLREVKKRGSIVNLTPNEYKILLSLGKRPKRVFTREELVALAFGQDYEGYDRSVDTHIKNLRQKIEDDSKVPSYIMTVYGVGYKFGGE